MVLCKATQKNGQEYSLISSQHINSTKGKHYGRGSSRSMMRRNADMLGFIVGQTQFNYLGAPEFKDNLRTNHL